MRGHLWYRYFVTVNISSTFSQTFYYPQQQPFISTMIIRYTSYLCRPIKLSASSAAIHVDLFTVHRFQVCLLWDACTLLNVIRLVECIITNIVFL
jgi:hypothetical protein